MSRVEKFVYILTRTHGFWMAVNKEECEKTVRYVVTNQDEAKVALEAIETFIPIHIEGFIIQKMADYSWRGQ